MGLGGSYAAGGVSGVGDYDDARIVATTSGPVVTWRNLTSASASLEALRFNGTSWINLGASSSVAGR